MKTPDYFIMILVLTASSFFALSIVHAELSDPLAPPPNDECLRKIMDQENSESFTYDEKKAIALAENSQDFKSQSYGYEYVFDHAYKHFDVDEHTCSATWQYVNVVFDLKDNQGNIVSQVTVLEDSALSKVISASTQQYTPPHFLPADQQPKYMKPFNNLDQRYSVAIYSGILTATAISILYLLKRRKDKVPITVSAVWILFFVLSVIFLAPLINLLFHFSFYDRFTESVYNELVGFFFIPNFPVYGTTSLVLDVVHVTNRQLEQIGGSITIILGLTSALTAFGMWTRRPWSWKSGVIIMFVQVGFDIVNLSRGYGVMMLAIIPSLVILGLFREDVRNYFRDNANMVKK